MAADSGDSGDNGNENVKISWLRGVEGELAQGLGKTVGVVRKSSGDIEGGAWKLLSLQQIGDFVEFFQKLRAFSELVAAK